VIGVKKRKSPLENPKIEGRNQAKSCASLVDGKNDRLDEQSRYPDLKSTITQYVQNLNLGNTRVAKKKKGSVRR